MYIHIYYIFIYIYTYIYDRQTDRLCMIIAQLRKEMPRKTKLIDRVGRGLDLESKITKIIENFVHFCANLLD